ncbi:MAG: RsmB/NOP family class I SAM-dependent RNA methyltransferase [Desulfovibrionaceae bacterium]|nr:RsmB/NOP family class I SAM-dependent RNA methyltransferase [Desulfovibrionaceae bacterium]
MDITNTNCAKEAGLRSFRINAGEAERPAVEALLRAEGFEFAPEPFSPAAFHLLAEPFPLGRSLAAFFGLVYIQDRSSMLPPLLLRPEPGDFVLDMCASPGSKTGLLAQLVGPEGAALANEPNPTRLGTLRANLSRQNFVQAVTCKFPGQEIPLPPESCSRILLDPPCSGWGTAEKNPQVMALWSGSKTRTLVGLQQLLLARAAYLLKPGGELVYSTCTTNPEENEEQLAWALDNLPLEQLSLQAPPGFETSLALSGGAVSIAPGRGEGQGFFMVKFRRSEGPRPDLPSLPSAPREWEHGSMLARSALDSELTDSSLLPPGGLLEYRDNVMFLPERIIENPPAFPVQGAFVGKLARGAVLPLPRMRSLLVPAGTGPGLDVEDIAPVHRLLSGQSLAVNLPGRAWIGLYYRSLPLALLRVKNGRAVWTER